MRRLAFVSLVLLPAVALASGFRASSFKKETRLGANYWNIASALDGKMDTCWMVDPESENVGEWFEVDVPRSEVDKLGLVIGWAKDEATFKDYARIKAVKVEMFGDAKAEDVKVGEATIAFEDKMGMQWIELPDTKVGGEITGGKVRVTVTEVYGGEDYPNLAVSELIVGLKEMDVPSTAIPFRTEPPSVAGHAAAMMTDNNPATFWSGTGDGLEFDIRPEGYGVSSLGIVPGPAGSARPKTVEITVSDITVSVTLPEPKAGEKPVPTWVNLPSVVGYTGSAWGTIHIKLIDSYPGPKDPNVAIGELKLRYTAYEAL